MKRIIAVLRSDEAAKAWLDLLTISDLVEIRIEDVHEDVDVTKRRSPTPGRSVHREGTPIYRILIDRLGINNPFPISTAVRIAEEKGYAPNTASATMSTMKNAGFAARRDSDGYWTFVRPIPADFKVGSK